MSCPVCEVKNCNRKALLLYGSKWVCGYCYMKAYTKKIEEMNKDLEDLDAN